MKKILLVIDTLASGGGQKLCLNLAKGLISKSYEVEIFVYDTKNKNFNFFNSEFDKLDLIIRTIKIEKVKSKLYSKFEIIFSLRKLLKTNQYDSIISFLHIPSIYSSVSRIGLKNNNLAVCELSSSNAPVSFIIRQLFYLACLLSDKVVTNSISEKQILSKKFLLSKKVHAIWNGFDTRNQEFNVNNNKKIIKKLVIIARVAYPKNGLNFLKGLSIFLDKNGWCPEVSWYGRKEIDDRSVKMQLEMNEFLETNSALKKYFKFCGESKNVSKLYKDFDALVLPSIYEGLPLVICEAMLSNCFVIS